jgi:hypothetical protein
VYELEPAKLAALGRSVPTEVHGVLRLFDGNRTIADVLEDCPFRVFETLRVTQRAVEVGLLKRTRLPAPRGVGRPLLPVEEWLLGSVVDDAIPTTVVDEPSAPVAPGSRSKNKKKNKKRRTTMHGVGSLGGKPAAPEVKKEIDWTPLIPRVTTADFSSLSPVVPSTMAAGEITVGEMTARVRRLTEPPVMQPATMIEPEPVAEAVKPSTRPVTADDAIPRVVASVETAPTRADSDSGDSGPIDPRALADDDDSDDAWQASRVRADSAPPPSGEPVTAKIAPITARMAAVVATAAPDADTAKAEAPKQESIERSETSGEIKLPARRRDSAPPPVDGPSILVEDMAAVHAAVSAVATTAAHKKGPDASRAEAGVAAEVAATRAAVAVVEAKAAHFTDDEEAFFHAGSQLHHHHSHVPHDSFADLDEGYQPQSFWQRLWGGKRKKRPPR